MALIKFLFSILLLPIVFAITTAFHGELVVVKPVYHLFTFGIVVFAITHLFVLNLSGIYQGGQKLLSDGLKFSPFLAGFIPLVLPLFPTLLMLTLYVAGKFFAMGQWEPYIIFFTGVTFAMHLILTAQILREEDTGLFKAHYFFVMGLGYIFNILIIAALFNLNFANLPFLKFFDQAMLGVKDIYVYIYSRLAGI